MWNPLVGSFVNAGNIRGPQGEKGERGDQGEKGNDGGVFVPAVSTDGVLSFNNNCGLPNPVPVSLKGDEGPQGVQGEPGLMYIPQVDGGMLSFRCASVPEDFESVNVQGAKGDRGDQGEKGDRGDRGEVMVPSYNKGILSWILSGNPVLPGPVKITPSVYRSVTEPMGVQEGDIWIVL